MLRLATALFFVAVAVLACSAGDVAEPIASSDDALVVGGCQCVSSGSCSQLSYSDVPSDGQYVVTTFGGGTDTHSMSCGGVADATWAYVAGSARFSCGTKLLVEANGKSCVALVSDCGPNRCVEEAAAGSCSDHFPVLDVSPYITKYLLGQSAAGWSENKLVHATVADPSAVVGCPGKSGSTGTGGGGSTGGGGTGNTGAGGSGGSSASCVAPTCYGCADCYDQCLCLVGNPAVCAGVCGAGTGGNTGAAGAGGGSAGLGSKGDVGDEGLCTAPACSGCEGCDDLCLCEGNDPATCAQQCGTAPSSAVCAAPTCGNCGGCHEACACNGLDAAVCANLCGAPDSPVAATPADPESCAAGSFVGKQQRGYAAERWPYLALLMLGLLRRRRSRSARS
ncbi:MAG: hypothetical protein R3B13_26130 [Polyangiaceae bacterium]